MNSRPSYRVRPHFDLKKKSFPSFHSNSGIYRALGRDAESSWDAGKNVTPVLKDLKSGNSYII